MSAYFSHMFTYLKGIRNTIYDKMASSRNNENVFELFRSSSDLQVSGRNYMYIIIIYFAKRSSKNTHVFKKATILFKNNTSFICLI